VTLIKVIEAYYIQLKLLLEYWMLQILRNIIIFGRLKSFINVFSCL